MAYLYPYTAGVQVPSFFETDKIEPHGYFPEYLKIAADIGPSGKVCEIGAYYGESLRMWQALFPLGEVTGVDCNPDAVFPDGVIRVIKSQDDPSLVELGPFDLIVDDASHEGVLTDKTFSLMWRRVKPGGYYVIEDWYTGLVNGSATQYDPEMLVTVESLPHRLLSARNAECDSVTFRYGLAIAHKRRGAALEWKR